VTEAIRTDIAQNHQCLRAALAHPAPGQLPEAAARIAIEMETVRRTIVLVDGAEMALAHSGTGGWSPAPLNA